MAGGPKTERPMEDRAITEKTNMENPIPEKQVKGRRKKRQRWPFPNGAAAVILCLGVILLGCLAYLCLADPIQARIDILPDKNAMDGRLHADSRPVEAGQYRVVVNQLPTIKSGSRECNIEFENPEGNQYNSRINLYLTSDGKRIGGTRRVDTGKYVETIKLNRTLEPGEHQALAKIELFTGTEPAGEMILEITLRVVEE